MTRPNRAWLHCHSFVVPSMKWNRAAVRTLVEDVVGSRALARECRKDVSNIQRLENRRSSASSTVFGARPGTAVRTVLD